MSVDISIGVQDMVVNQLHSYGNNSCIFISITPSASDRICSCLNLHNNNNNKANSVFDCNSSGAPLRMLVCLFVCLCVCVFVALFGCVCFTPIFSILSVLFNPPHYEYTPPPPAEMCKKYIIIFLRALHRDQEEALLNAKINADTSYLKRNAPMFLKLNLPTTINLLAKIVENSSGEDAWLMHQGVVGAPGGWLVHQGVVGWLSG